jgi:NAD-dependent deacetylase
MDEMINRVASWIVSYKKLVVFTGAGVSTESGIPDFRSPGGVWSRYDPEDFTFKRFLASEEVRSHYWQMSTELYQMLKTAKPNAAHMVIATLERMGRLDCVITQNIDGLHQSAGCAHERVIELHGTALSVKCLGCGRTYERDEVQDRIKTGDRAPTCDDCQGPLKPATISFGQQMPERETAEAFRKAKSCEVFLVIGSSLLVQPAASLPIVARDNEAFLGIINKDATPYDRLAQAVIHGSAGVVLEHILRVVNARLQDKPPPQEGTQAC